MIGLCAQHACKHSEGAAGERNDGVTGTFSRLTTKPSPHLNHDQSIDKITTRPPAPHGKARHSIARPNIFFPLSEQYPPRLNIDIPPKVPSCTASRCAPIDYTLITTRASSSHLDNTTTNNDFDATL
jgi:hypothetical protein